LTRLDVEFLDLLGESLPLADTSAVTVVDTFSLCTGRVDRFFALDDADLFSLLNLVPDVGASCFLHQFSVFRIAQRTDRGQMLEASWKLDNLSWHKTCSLHSSWEEISDIKLDDFSHIPLHANYDAWIPSWENPATTVDSALPNSSRRSRAGPSSYPRVREDRSAARWSDV
jgi:hypothetical protein